MFRGLDNTSNGDPKGRFALRLIALANLGESGMLVEYIYTDFRSS